MSPATATVSTRVNPLDLDVRSPTSIWLVIFFILSCSPVLAQKEVDSTETTQIEFLTEPPKLRVYKLNRFEGDFDYVGLSNNGQISVPYKLSQKNEEWKFKVKAPQFSEDDDSWPEQIFDANGAEEIIKASRYPKTGAIRLELSLWQRFQAEYIRRPARTLITWLSAPALLLLVLVGLLTRRAWLPRWQKWFGGSAQVPQTDYGDYTVLRQLGKGAMGIVYLGQTQSGLKVALKSVLPEYAEDPEFNHRFEHEIRACISLDHPNLLKYYGHGIDSAGVPFSVTELLHGKTLKETLSEGVEHPQRLASDLVEQIGSALDYLHGQGLVHRDIKPDNIFVCDDGNLKLMDLGLVKGEAMTVLTRTGHILGTPAYMPPEQFDGQTGPASDQYALGIILYEILAGTRPFRQPDLFALAYQHKTAIPTPLREIEPRVTEDVDQAVLRMIAKRPEGRFPSISAVSDAISDKLLYLPWPKDVERKEKSPE